MEFLVKRVQLLEKVLDFYLALGRESKPTFELAAMALYETFDLDTAGGANL